MNTSRTTFAPMRAAIAGLALFLLSTALGGTALADTATVTAGSPGGYLSPLTTSTSVPVTISRSVATAAVGFSVDFTVSSELTVPANGITNGDFLASSGLTPEFHVRALTGAGHYVVDGVILGNATQCGTSALTGTLFNIALTAAATTGTGTVTINSVTLRDCNNATLPTTTVSPATVAIDYTAPLVSVTSPVGGEFWVQGSVHNITWSATDDVGFGSGPVSLDVSTDNGATWSPIAGATGLASSGSFAWTLPATLSTTAKVRATATDVNGNAGQGASAAVFTIAGTTSVTVETNHAPSVFGQAVTFTATVAPAAAGGTVQFSVDGIPSGVAVGVVGGIATSAPRADLSVGTHAVTAVYSGDASYAGSSGALSPDQSVGKATSATAVTTSGSPSLVGGSVTFTASVTAVAPGAGTPAGSVDFSVDGGLAVAGTFGAGVWTYTTTALTAGPHTVSASYLGDGNFLASNGSVAQQVDKNATTTTLAVSPLSPSVFGESVTLTATVSAGTGTVTFMDGLTPLGTQPVSGTTASLSTTALAVGSGHSFTATYNGDATYATSTSDAVLYTVDKATSATAVTTSGSPSLVGGSVTFTATVTAVAPGAGTPAGSVDFSVDGGLAVAGTFGSGVWTYTTTALTAGPHTVSASYLGDGNFIASNGSVAQQVDKNATTTTLAVSPLSPSAFGETVTLTATVSAGTGTVTFKDGLTVLGTQPVSGTTAVLSTSTLAVGSGHSFTATYNGDGTYLPSTSDAAPYTVGSGATTTALTVDTNPSVYQDAVLLTATVSTTPPATGTATGTVTFYDGATPLGTGTLNGSGVATRSVSTLSIGTHSLTAVYASDGSYGGSTSPVVSHEVQIRIVATAGANGTIAPPGTTLYGAGTSAAFTLTPASGYHITAVTADGVAAALTSPYTFASPQTQNHTIDVQFALNPAVSAISGLTAATLRSGNGSSGIARIHVSWPAVTSGTVVHVYHADFGNYPEYDSGSTPGLVPSLPSYEPGGSWSLAGSVTVPGTSFDDTPPARGFWYYVAFVEDQYGTISPVSNMTGGALDYFLGDVTNGHPGEGDNQVTTIDVSLLGNHYGNALVAADPFDYLDVGPTTDHGISSRPMPDRELDFEDLVVFAINFGTVTAPQANAHPNVVASATDEVVLEAPASTPASGEVAVRLLAHGTGRMQGVSTTLSWDPAVVEPVGFTPGDYVLQQGGVVLSAKPGIIDAAILGVHDRGLTGEGELATLTFRALAAGDAKFAIRSVVARDAANRGVVAGTAVQHPVPQVPAVTSFSPAAPNPFRGSTALAFGLARAGTIELALFSVDGRRVRTLANGPYAAGNYRLAWDGRDDGGRLAAPGVYYARLVTEQGRFKNKLVLTR